jgi:hypothetical protein
LLALGHALAHVGLVKLNLLLEKLILRLELVQLLPHGLSHPGRVVLLLTLLAPLALLLLALLTLLLSLLTLRTGSLSVSLIPGGGTLALLCFFFPRHCFSPFARLNCVRCSMLDLEGSASTRFGPRRRNPSLTPVKARGHCMAPDGGG